uniref:Uncharacterized protein n=1 Tax=Lepeophtheirus salmonis TaxID=72036 RepID=A0A0K2VCT7_LEPSM
MFSVFTTFKFRPLISIDVLCICFEEELNCLALFRTVSNCMINFLAS